MKKNFYWVMFIDFSGIQDKSIIEASSKADAIITFKNLHPGYKTLGAKMVPKN